MADFWSEHIVFAKVLGRYEVASLTIEIAADSNVPLPDAFKLTFTVRGLGVQIGRLENVPLKNGPITIALSAPGAKFGDLKGAVSNWHGLDKDGHAIDPIKDPHWKTAATVAFSLTSVADVAIPVSELVALVPHLGWLLGIIVKLFGDKITVTLASQPISLPIRRDTNGNLIPVSHA
jgi:hypothetical protein